MCVLMRCASGPFLRFEIDAKAVRPVFKNRLLSPALLFKFCV
jgi:hypothetical protein